MSKAFFDLENDHDYTLIGIHTTLEDYRLAFFLNRAFDLRLARGKEDLDFESNNCHFSYFEYNDERTLETWHLISNKFTLVTPVTSGSSNLFDSETEIAFLIPEKPRIDFFLKTSEQKDWLFIKEVTTGITKIKQVVAAYEIDPYELRSRDNLIII